MLYYKVIKDNVHDYFTGYTTVKHELLTKCERNSKFRYLSDNCFTIVNVNKNNTYKLFGCRFENVE